MASAILYVLQLPLGPLAQALGREGGLRVLLLLLALAVGNAVVWAVVVRAVWGRAGRRGGTYVEVGDIVSTGRLSADASHTTR